MDSYSFGKKRLNLYDVANEEMINLDSQLTPDGINKYLTSLLKEVKEMEGDTQELARQLNQRTELHKQDLLLQKDRLKKFINFILESEAYSRQGIIVSIDQGVKTVPAEFDAQLKRFEEIFDAYLNDNTFTDNPDRGIKEKMFTTLDVDELQKAIDFEEKVGALINQLGLSSLMPTIKTNLEKLIRIKNLLPLISSFHGEVMQQSFEKAFKLVNRVTYNNKLTAGIAMKAFKGWLLAWAVKNSDYRHITFMSNGKNYKFDMAKMHDQQPFMLAVTDYFKMKTLALASEDIINMDPAWKDNIFMLMGNY